MRDADAIPKATGFLNPIYFTKLRQLGEEVDFNAKQIHLLPIGLDNYVWLILSGWMFGLRSDEEGRLKTTCLQGPGDLIGIAGFAERSHHDVQVYALTSVHCLRIGTCSFVRQCHSNSDLSSFLVEYMSARYDRLLFELQRSVLMPLNSRIDTFLSEVDLHLRATARAQGIRIPEEVIGWGVGAHPGSVSRALRRQRTSADEEEFAVFIS